MNGGRNLTGRLNVAPPEIQSVTSVRETLNDVEGAGFLATDLSELEERVIAHLSSSDPVVIVLDSIPMLMAETLAQQAEALSRLGGGALAVAHSLSIENARAKAIARCLDELYLRDEVPSTLKEKNRLAVRNRKSHPRNAARGRGY